MQINTSKILDFGIFQILDCGAKQIKSMQILQNLKNLNLEQFLSQVFYIKDASRY